MIPTSSHRGTWPEIRVDLVMIDLAGTKGPATARFPHVPVVAGRARRSVLGRGAG